VGRAAIRRGIRFARRIGHSKKGEGQSRQPQLRSGASPADQPCSHVRWQLLPRSKDSYHNHNGDITVHVTGTNTNWSESTNWTASGVSGWSVASKTYVSATSYTVVLTPPAAASPPTGATGTLTLKDISRHWGPDWRRLNPGTRSLAAVQPTPSKSHDKRTVMRILVDERCSTS
jgi:hypothetical protein